MARMTMTIDEGLLKEARRRVRARTKRETLEIALRELVRRARRRELAAHAGTIDLGLTQEKLAQ